jgi:hypothetical protein
MNMIAKQLFQIECCFVYVNKRIKPLTAETQRKSGEHRKSLFSAVAFPLRLCVSAANGLVLFFSIILNSHQHIT